MINKRYKIVIMLIVSVLFIGIKVEGSINSYWNFNIFPLEPKQDNIEFSPNGYGDFSLFNSFKTPYKHNDVFTFNMLVKINNLYNVPMIRELKVYEVSNLGLEGNVKNIIIPLSKHLALKYRYDKFKEYLLKDNICSLSTLVKDGQIIYLDKYSLRGLTGGYIK